jgi:hypothetical protein
VSGTLAVAVVCGVLGVCGLGVLALLGVARSGPELVRMSPLAPLAGMAWVGIAAATAATAGVPFGLVGLLLVTVATCAAGGLRLARADAPRVETAARPAGSWAELALATVSLGVLAVVVGYGLATYGVKPLVEYDGWAMWGMKAKAIAWLDADRAVLASETYERLHLEYPLLLPALHALPIDAAESFASNIVVLNCVAIGLAGLLALWGLMRGRVRAGLLVPFLAAIAAMPAFFVQLGTGYADAPLAVLVAAGVGAAAVWLLDRRAAWLALATLFLAAAALTKNEGLLFALAALVALLSVASGRRRAVAVSAGVVALVYAPWRVYTSVHDLGAGDYDLASSFDPLWVARRLHRAPDSVWAVLERAGRPREVGVLLVVGLACGLLAIVLGRTGIGVFATGFAVLSLAGLAWIYVISPLELSSYTSGTAHRVVLSAVIGLAALCPLLLEESARALAAGGESSAGAGSLTPGGPESPVLRRDPPP